jgi:hypothetical protein
MPWTDPRVWVAGELVTAAIMNAHIRDNLEALAVPVTGAYQNQVTGPHAIGTTVDGHLQLRIAGSFTADAGGPSAEAVAVQIGSALTAVTGNTGPQALLRVIGTITTQNNSETIPIIAAVVLEEPGLTIGTDTVADASTLYVKNAPTEGTRNWAALISGATRIDGDIAIANAAEGGIGRLTRRTARDVVTLTGASTDTTTISIPAGALLLGASFNVNTAVVDDGGDDTWSAAFVTGSTTVLATAAAAALNTKVNKLIVSELATATTQIRFTPNGGNFTAGVIEVVVYYEMLTSLANA